MEIEKGTHADNGMYCQEHEGHRNNIDRNYLDMMREEIGRNGEPLDFENEKRPMSRLQTDPTII